MSRFGHHSSGSKPASSSRHHFQAIAFDPNRQDRSSSPRLRETRFPAQSTFCRDRSPSPFALARARWEPSDSMPGMIPRLCVTRGSVCPISAASRFPRFATSFGLDTLSVRTLSSTHRRGAKNLPSDVCHPNLYPSAPVLSSLDFDSGSHPTSSRDSSVHADQARFGGTARTSRELFAGVLRGDRHL